MAKFATMAKDISFHITDIFFNSGKAASTEVKVEVCSCAEYFEFRISDNGCGMSSQRLSEVLSATHSERNDGWGIILLKQSIERCGGDFSLESEEGRGTVVWARFPMGASNSFEVGDLAQTLAMILTGTPEVSVRLRLAGGNGEFEISTSDLESVAQGFPLSHVKVATLVKELLNTKLKECLDTKISDKNLL